MASDVTINAIVRVLVQTPQAREGVQRVQALSSAIRESGRELYRYTFYAMWFAQVINAYLGLRLMRAFAGPAGAMEQALASFRAFGEATEEQSERMRSLAFELAGLYPFTASEIVRAATEMAKAGLTTEQALQNVAQVIRYATLEGASLAETASFLATMMNVFGMGAEETAAAIDQIAMAANRSKYSFSQMRYALDMTMATAGALGQTLPELLTTLTALGRAGFPAAQAATMINAMFARLGDPEVMAFLQAALEYVQSVPELMATMGGEPPVLFPEWGEEPGRWIGDIGEVMIAAAQALWHAVQTSADTVAARIEALRIMTSVFGVRNIRAFLALAQFQYELNGQVLQGVEAYRALKREIMGASGTAQEMLEQLQGTWERTLAQLRTNLDTFKVHIGTGIIGMFNPLLRATTEVVEAFNKIISKREGLRNVISTLMGLAAALSALTAAIGAISVAFTLALGKLRDIGTNEAVLAELSKRYSKEELEAMTPTRRGVLYLSGPFLRIWPLIRSLAFLSVLGAIAWTRDIAGLRSVLKPLVSVLMTPGKLSTIIVDALRRVFGPGTTLGTLGQGISAGFMRTVEFVLKGLVEIFRYVLPPLIDILKGVFEGFMKILRGMAWVVGLGDVSKGLERLGNVLGTLLAVGALVKAFQALYHILDALHGLIISKFVMRLGKFALSLAGALINPMRRIFTILFTLIGTLLAKVGLLQKITGVLNLLGGGIGAFLAKLSGKILGFLGIDVLLGTIGRGMLIGKAAGIGGVLASLGLWKLLLLVGLPLIAGFLIFWLIRHFSRRQEPTAALPPSPKEPTETFAAARATPPLQPKIEIPSPPKEKLEVPAPPAPTAPAKAEVSVAVAPAVFPAAPVTQNITFQPTIIVPSGTPEEQAEYILKRLREEVPTILAELNWRDAAIKRGEALRSYGLYAQA